MAILPFLAMCFMDVRGFVYTIAMDVYAFRCAFSGKLHRILQHFALRLAPKRTLFCSKTHSILQQNALHLAAKRALFCSK